MNIDICGKSYKIECNAFTYVQFKKIFKIGIFEDIQKVQTFTIMQSINYEKIKKENPEFTEEQIEESMGKIMFPVLDEYFSSVTRLTWMLIYSADEKVENYEKWLKSITKFKINDNWIVEVTKYVVECF